MTDIARLIAKLEQQRGTIDKAISALRDIEVPGPAAPKVAAAATAVKAAAAPAKKSKKKNRLSPEGRRKIAEAAKRYWAAKKAAQATQAKKPAVKK